MNLDLLDPKVIAPAVVVVLVIVVIGLLYIRKRRSAAAELRQKFGTEYDRAVKEHGSERKAEAKLEDREKRVEKLNIRELDALEHERFSKQWASIQSRLAHEIVQRLGKGETTTEELRTAMIHYRSLFDELAHMPVVVERKEVA